MALQERRIDAVLVNEVETIIFYQQDVCKMNGPGGADQQCWLRIGCAHAEDHFPFSLPDIGLVTVILGAAQHCDPVPATVNLQRQMDSVALLHPIIPYFGEALEPLGDPRHSMPAHW